MAVPVQTVPPHRSTRRAWLRWSIGTLIALVVLAAVALAAGSWYFSSQLLDVSHTPGPYSIDVTAIGSAEGTSQVTLSRTTDTMRRGRFGIDWPHGHAIIGAILRSNAVTVTRLVQGDTAGLTAGMHVQFNAYVYTSPAAVHLAYRAIRYPDPLGPMPAWYIPGRRATWVIIAHGYKNIRAEGVRPMPVLSRFGLPILDIDYRNDAGAPQSPDGLYHLGASEWQDVQAAVRYALAHGAHDVILYGFSMGGGTVEDFLHHSPLASKVRGVILDSPALDWGSVLQLAGEQRHVPGILIAVTKRVVAWRLGLSSLNAIDDVTQTRDLRAPTLVFDARDDQLVPFGPTATFAHARPHLITFYAVPNAGHTQSWNVDPARYDARLSAFLRTVLAAP